MYTWISVEDELPSDDRDVLVTDGSEYAVGYWRPDAKAWDSTAFGWLEREGWLKREEDQEWDGPSYLEKITHWTDFQKLVPYNTFVSVQFEDGCRIGKLVSEQEHTVTVEFNDKVKMMGIPKDVCSGWSKKNEKVQET